MKSKNITPDTIYEFSRWLHSEEHSMGTVEKYVRDVKALGVRLNGCDVSKEKVVEWKMELLEAGYSPVTINSMLASVNAYCRFAAIDCRIKLLKVQKRVFREADKELTQTEYERLIDAAKSKGNERLALLMETVGATGIRVSEVRYITAEAVRLGRTQIVLKGKIRDIFLPSKLCRKLMKYAKKQKIISGELFVTRNGKSLSRKQIWAEMKTLCVSAHVEPTKVFPHNLRHLFARVYYQARHDISKLADLLGHSSIETTRIYLISSGAEHARQIEQLGLVI